YIANYNAAAGTTTGLRQVTKTKNGLPVATPDVSPDPTATANLLTFGRRLSLDGRWIVFESLATDPKGNGANTSAYGPFVYDNTTDTFTQLVPRADNI